MRIQLREELVNALMDAAELEHNLACLYLFAQFSLKKNESEINNVPAGDVSAVYAQMTAWNFELRKIAQQEMGHLATVNNLLTLLGAEAHFDRPNFPPPDGFYPPTAAFVLERFGMSSLRRFVEFERNDASPGVQRMGLAPQGVSYQHVGELYKSIADAFQDATSGGIALADDQLFLGYQKPMDRQWISSTVEVHEFGLHDAHATPLNQLRSKVREALQDVMEEGEGSPAPGEDSHYEIFFKIADELRRLIAKYSGFEPARAVANNPMVQRHRDAGLAINLITAQPAKDIAELFNSFYGSMVLALRQLFAFSENLADASRLQKIHRVCTYLMQGAIAPLGAHLTELPLANGSADRAGPGFELYRPMYISSVPKIVWTVITERVELADAECDRLIAGGMLRAETTAVLQSVKIAVSKIKQITQQLL